MDYLYNHIFSILDSFLLVSIIIQGSERLKALQKLIDKKDSLIAAKSEAIAKVALGLNDREDT